MTEFRFSVLSGPDKKKFILHRLIIVFGIFLMTYIAIKLTNPVIYTMENKMSVTMGAIFGGLVLVLTLFNRLKSWLKIKFVGFLIAWVLLMTLQTIMSTLVLAIGLNLIPLMIDDILIVPYWKNVWYNNYER